MRVLLESPEKGIQLLAPTEPGEKYVVRSYSPTTDRTLHKAEFHNLSVARKHYNRNHGNLSTWRTEHRPRTRRAAK